MKARRERWARVLAIVGTVLVWLPVVAPLVLGVAFWFQRRRLLIDFLMPAELFGLILAGGLLLVSAALLARRRVWRVAGPLLGAVLLLAGSQGLAVVTGLAHGTTPAEGWPFALVLTVFGLFVAAVVALGVAGIVLARELRRRQAT